MIPQANESQDPAKAPIQVPTQEVPEPHDLINRLRGIYVIPVNDGAGLLDGKDIYTRVFDVPPINLLAATMIEDLLAVVAWLAKYQDDLNNLRVSCFAIEDLEKVKKTIVMEWPVIQGTQLQIWLTRIGELPASKESLGRILPPLGRWAANLAAEKARAEDNLKENEILDPDPVAGDPAGVPQEGVLRPDV